MTKEYSGRGALAGVDLIFAEGIAEELREPLPTDLAPRFMQTDQALEELWDEATGQYCSRDAVYAQLQTEVDWAARTRRRINEYVSDSQ